MYTEGCRRKNGVAIEDGNRDIGQKWNKRREKFPQSDRETENATDTRMAAGRF